MSGQSPSEAYALMLGLPKDVTSPDHYQLLGIARFTEDPKVIRDAAIAQNGKLLQWQISDAHHQRAREIILELVEAKTVLLDPDRKREYDAELRQKLPETPSADYSPLVNASAENTPPKDYDANFLKMLWSLVGMAGLLGAGVIGWNTLNTRRAEEPSPTAETPTEKQAFQADSTKAVAKEAGEEILPDAEAAKDNSPKREEMTFPSDEKWSAELAQLQTEVERCKNRPANDPEVIRVRKELIQFRLKYYGTPATLLAARLMSQLRWPVDDFQRDQIAPYELRVAGAGDVQEAPAGLVHVMGESRLKHWSDIEFLDFSPDGQSLVSAGRDRDIVVWDVKTGDQKQILAGLPARPRCARFSPSGRRVAFCMGVKNDQKIPETSNVYIWNVTTGQIENILRGGHTKPITRVNWNADGSKLVSSSYDKNVVIWDVELRVQAQTLRLKDHYRIPVCWATNQLAVQSTEGLVQLRDLATDQPLPSAWLPKEAQVGLAFSEDGQLLVCTDDARKSLFLCDLKQRSLLHKMSCGEALYAACFTPDNQSLMTADSGGSVRFWNVSTGKEDVRKRINSPRKSFDVFDLAVDSNANVFAHAGHIGCVAIRDLKTRKRLHDHLQKPVGHNARMWHVAMSLSGETLASQGREGSIVSWDAIHGTILSKVWGTTTIKPRGIEISPNGAIIGYPRSWWSSPLQLFDSQTGKRVGLLKNFYAEECAFSPDGQHVAIGTNAKTDHVIIHNYQTGKEALRFGHPKGSAQYMAYTPDGELLLTNTYYGKNSRIWEASTGKQVGDLKAHSGRVNGFDFRADGARLLTMSAAKELKIWDFAERKVIAELIDPKTRETIPWCRWARFSPDGTRVAAYFGQGVVRIWDAKSRRILHQFSAVKIGSHRGIKHLFFTPEGRHLITSNNNGTFSYFRIADLPTEIPDLNELVNPKPLRLLPSRDLASKPNPPPSANPPSPANPSPAAKPAEKEPPPTPPSSNARFEVIWRDNPQLVKWDVMPELTAEELQDALRDQRRRNFVPVSIGGYTNTEGEPRFCTLWTFSTNQTLIRYGDTRDTFQKEFDNRPRDFRLLSRDFYRVGNETHTAFVFHKMPQYIAMGTKSNYTRSGFQTHLDSYEQRGYRPVMLSGFLSGSGKVRYYGQWFRDNQETQHKLDLSLEECKNELDQLKMAGLQLIWLDAYTKGNDRFYSYVAIKPLGKILPWDVSYGLTFDKLEEELKTRRKARQYPTVINVESSPP